MLVVASFFLVRAREEGNSAEEEGSDLVELFRLLV